MSCYASQHSLEVIMSFATNGNKFRIKTENNLKYVVIFKIKSLWVNLKTLG